MTGSKRDGRGRSRRGGTADDRLKRTRMDMGRKQKGIGAFKLGVFSEALMVR